MNKITVKQLTALINKLRAYDSIKISREGTDGRVTVQITENSKFSLEMPEE